MKQTDYLRESILEFDDNPESLLQWLIDLTSKKNSNIHVCEYKKEIVGVAYLEAGNYSKFKHYAEFSVFVDKDHWGKGIASELMERLFQNTGSLKYIKLWVNATNHSAVNLYKKYGFKQTGVLPNDFNINGSFSDTLLMVKEL